MNVTRYGRLIVLLLFLLISLSIQSPLQARSRSEAGWEVSTPEAEFSDPKPVARVLEAIEAGEFPTLDGFVLIKNGKLVAEAYGRGYDRDRLHPLYSVTKSISSALIGIALSRGDLKSLDAPLLSFFPEYEWPNLDPRKKAITLRQMLTQTTGLAWDERTYPFGDARNSYTRMSRTGDWFHFTIREPLEANPGEKWIYNTGVSQLFAPILEKAIGRSPELYARELLLEPLGIKKHDWAHDPRGNLCTGGGGGGLSLRPIDAAKFGFLYLHGGRWKDRQIIPEEWVADSFGKHAPAWGSAYYGYQWWILDVQTRRLTIETRRALGFGEQVILLVPGADMVAVFTGHNWEWKARLGKAIELLLQAAAPELLSSGELSSLRTRTQ